jgi:hypothetical protein
MLKSESVFPSSQSKSAVRRRVSPECPRDPSYNSKPAPTHFGLDGFLSGLVPYYESSCPLDTGDGAADVRA